ncbi:unnamed protein product [Owenia fusiformis]|uniref:Uncharacterized protein n=1 Tax=Owenia fusiformis TaxID=6347 RepID=A0A8S4QB89_OWEFU|nr:unnamed protein product [Owenia fusiformis]
MIMQFIKCLKSYKKIIMYSIIIILFVLVLTRYNGSPIDDFPVDEISTLKTKFMISDVKIVTAADCRYFSGLIEFVASIHYWEPNMTVIVYDLGLQPEQKKEAESWCNVQINALPVNTPDHIKKESRKRFSWKALVLQDAVMKYGAIFYSDAGSVIRAPLEPIKKLIIADGHFFVQGQDEDTTTLLHKGMYAYFGVNVTQLKGKPSFAGSVHGYVRGGLAEKHILRPLVKCSISPECITPIGSSLRNHRFDQSALSIIIYTSGIKIQPHTELLITSLNQLSENPFLPSSRIIWTSRQASYSYSNQICTKKTYLDKK